MPFNITNSLTIGRYAKKAAASANWVAGGQGSMIANSMDGNDWTEAATKGGIGYGFDVAYGKDGAGNGRWVAVGSGGVIAYSPNGNDWTNVPLASRGGITSPGYGVAFKNEII